MNNIQEFTYKPTDHESERASNSYLMSLIAIMAGLPLPIINLIATLIFFLGNRKGTHFVRWHCTQALLSQLSLLIINSVGFWWTIAVLLHSDQVTSNYVAYIITLIIFNIAEFATTIYSAIAVRKGKHIQWWFYGTITNLICRS